MGSRKRACDTLLATLVGRLSIAALGGRNTRDQEASCMETTLLNSGLACLIASIIGGGLKAFGIEIPLLTTWPRQIALFFLGLMLCLTAFSLRPPLPNNRAPSTPSEAAAPATPKEPPGKSAALAAPVPQGPVCGTTIAWPREDHFFILSWTAVKEASTYNVEVDCFGCSGRDWYSFGGSPWHVQTGLGLRTPIYSSNIHVQLRNAGGRALRWRVWAVDPNGQEGEKSSWCQIAFAGG